jgi:inorganic triphosphatase YgiF
MEIELKYKIESAAQMNQIWEDDFFRDMEEKSTRTQIFMKAAYFDTEDHILSQNDIAFRIRVEGEKVVGTLKWRDTDVGISGLYMRQEVNVPVADAACFLSPDPAMFKESSEGCDLLEVLGGKPLVSLFETHFMRKKFRIDNGKCICEVSLDEGEIVADTKRTPISELEIELFSGSRDELLKIGEKVAAKYELKPEPLSKYARGAALFKSR